MDGNVKGGNSAMNGFRYAHLFIVYGLHYDLDPPAVHDVQNLDPRTFFDLQLLAHQVAHQHLPRDRNVRPPPLPHPHTKDHLTGGLGQAGGHDPYNMKRSSQTYIDHRSFTIDWP